mmetsp:Transcript_16257/g.37685  ORF Transcript_16257/g.37685 Transcript_16257/m.37685 type:complete len:246 (+) Transcript_16257:1102-1839(+)
MLLYSSGPWWGTARAGSLGSVRSDMAAKPSHLCAHASRTALTASPCRPRVQYTRQRSLPGRASLPVRMARSCASSTSACDATLTWRRSFECESTLLHKGSCGLRPSSNILKSPRAVSLASSATSTLSGTKGTPAAAIRPLRSSHSGASAASVATFFPAATAATFFSAATAGALGGAPPPSPFDATAAAAAAAFFVPSLATAAPSLPAVALLWPPSSASEWDTPATRTVKPDTVPDAPEAAGAKAA